MLKTRLIPVLLLKSGRMVKPVRFEESGIRDVGDPVTTARIYDSQDADELIFLNIGKDAAFLQGTLRTVAQNCFVPLTAGGGVRTLEDITGLLRAGADKVSLNTAALEDPSFIERARVRFGAQCIVVSIDVRGGGGGGIVYKNGGNERTNWNALSWAREVAKRGAGEILLTSIEREGTMGGYDLKLCKAVSEAVNIPVIINGGAGSRADFAKAIKEGGVSAVAALSVFHFSDSNLTQVKSFLLNEGIPMRPI